MYKSDPVALQCIMTQVVRISLKMLTYRLVCAVKQCIRKIVCSKLFSFKEPLISWISRVNFNPAGKMTGYRIGLVLALDSAFGDWFSFLSIVSLINTAVDDSAAATVNLDRRITTEESLLAPLGELRRYAYDLMSFVYSFK